MKRQALSSLAQRMRYRAVRTDWAFRRATANMRLRPTFLIIGASKSGTTSLHRYLLENPAVLCACRKEIRYFALKYHRGERWYRAQFPLGPTATLRRLRASVRPVVGEASPIYLFHPYVPARVHAFNPDMKLIAVLRDPVDRAHSHYHMQMRWGWETLSFEEALDREDARLDGELAKLHDNPLDYPELVSRMSYVARGRYAEQLERWFELFPREQMLLLTSDELFSDPARTTSRVTRFLEIPEHHATSYARLAGGGGVFDYSPMNPATRERLARAFEPHNRRLEELLGRELHWTRPAAAAREPAQLQAP